MNILLISAIYPEPERYGLKKDTLAVHYFARQWVKKGNKVLVVHPYYNGVGKISDFIKIHKLGICHSEIEGVTVIFGSSQMVLPHALKPFLFQERCLATRIKKYIRNNFPDFVPDVVSVHFPYVLWGFVEKFCESEIPALAVFHGTDVRQLLLLKSSKKKGFAYMLNSRYKLFGFRSPLLLEKSCNGFLDKSKSTIVLSGLDEALIADKQSVSEKAEAPLNEGTLSIIYAGKLVKQKRIDFVLQALSLVKDELPFRFYIVGDGEELSNLQTRAACLGLKDMVVFTGRVSREKLSGLMRKSDVFIMMSTNETLGLVYLEAMAQGCIPVGSKGEGIDGIIKDGENGYLCNPYNLNDLSDTIRKIYSLSKEKKRDYILNAYYTVRDMTEKRLAERYLDILRNISNYGNK